MQIIKIGLTNKEYNEYLAEEATWTKIDGVIPNDYLEYRFHDGSIDRGFPDMFDIEDLESYRPVDAETKLRDELKQAQAILNIEQQRLDNSLKFLGGL